MTEKDETGYFEEGEVTGRVDTRIYLQIAPCDVDNPDDTLPDLADIKWRIEERLLDAAADDISNGRSDIEVDDIDDLAAEMLEIIKAEKAADHP